MNIPSKSELRGLMEQHNGPCISMFLPTHRVGEAQQNILRLRNQIREAGHRLLLCNLRASKTEVLLEPMQALLEDEDFWLHPGDGLALFRSPDVFRAYHLPCHFKEQVIVTNYFYLKPLLPLLTDDGRFYILALSHNDVRLLVGTRYSVSETTLPETVPRSLDEAMQYDESDNELQYHSSSSGLSIGKGGRRPTIFHGQGVGTDDEKERLLRYFQQVDRGLHELLRDEKTPLVLAGVAYLFPIYREANTFPFLLHEGVPGNPDKLSPETLRGQAWDIVEPVFLQARQVAAARYSMHAATGQTSNNLREIVPAACYGRIASLFVAIDQEQWGTFNPTTNTLHVHREARFKDDDLLDLAATQTLLHGGSVYAVEHTQMPDEGQLAAVYRY